MTISVINFGVVKRSEGRSSVGGAAYMAGRYLYDQNTKTVHNHCAKQGVLHSEIVAPVGSPDWAYDQKQLWNKVESSERWKTAQVAREGYAALPRELTHEQNIELARKFLKENFVDDGMIVDFAFHETIASDGGTNPHIHFQITMREVDIETEEFSKTKNRQWNDKNNVNLWRKSFGKIVNQALADANLSSRIDMRSYKDQGLNKMPMVHMGKEATALERKGVLTKRGDINRMARMANFWKERAQNKIKSVYQLVTGLFSEKPKISEAENLFALHLKHEASKVPEPPTPPPIHPSPQFHNLNNPTRTNIVDPLYNQTIKA